MTQIPSTRFPVPRLSILPLLLGLLFFAASLTPSLIPRDAIVQGALAGLVTAIGYMIGRLLLTIWRAAEMPRLTGRAAIVGHAIVAIPILATLALALGKSLGWQNAIRARMGMELLPSSDMVTLLGIAAAVFALCFAVGWVVQGLFDWTRHRLYRFMPERRANVLGLLLIVGAMFLITRDGLIDRVIVTIDTSYAAAQELFEDAPPPPTDPRLPGSAASLIDWEAMGRPGRNFITSGPDSGAITSFTGKPASDPIRVYVGRAQGANPQERADLALAELKRLGAFDREVLVIASPTGTGWLDPGSHDPLEYMHGGDIATVAVQYSYLQSPLALILETDAGLEQASAIIHTIHDYWQTLPEDSRPRLYIHGLSLGAWSSMYGIDLFRLVDDPIDGAFWAGPPFPSNFWNMTQRARNPDSPWVRPRVRNGSLVRYFSHGGTGNATFAPWVGMRIVFLQYASDPIVFYEPASLWRAPQWMREPPASDVSPELQFIPVVTQVQLAVDMALATLVPGGHGHSYIAQDYIPAWVEVTAPEGWTEADTARLIKHCDNGFKMGCNNR